MSDRVLFVLTFVSALGCGLVAGIFFAFSTFVMPALARLAPAHGIDAMNSINITVINPAFMLAFLGSGVTCAALLVSAWLAPHRPGTIFLVAGSLLYLVGNIVVTMAFNVPRNDALAAVATSSSSPEAARLWADYLVSWVMWNHVRTATALAAAALQTIALTRQA